MNDNYIKVLLIPKKALTFNERDKSKIVVLKASLGFRSVRDYARKTDRGAYII